MTKTMKTLIIEIVIIILIALSIYAIFALNVDLKIFKLVSLNSLVAKHKELDTANNELMTSKTLYDSTVKSLEDSKKNYKKEKSKYDAITDETLTIIKEATTNEEYDIEYMWIKLGNYAKKNNLTISLIEPGGSKTEEPKTEDKGNSDNSQTNSTEKTPSSEPKKETDSSTQKEISSESSSETAPGGNIPGKNPESNNYTNGEFSISVTGNYLDLSEFVFNVENDVELRFKLDKINMTYSGSNNITTTFVVKNIVFKK